MDYEREKMCVGAINRKRILPQLKGDALHDFKNEYNTVKQIIWPFKNYDNLVDYRLALHWAAWGAVHLKDYFGMSEEEMNKMDTRI